MDANLLPELDSELGYSERHLVSICGDDMANFHVDMFMKTYALGVRRPIYYPSDVHHFVEHMLPP